jgi:prephenate dehydratase
VSTDLSSQVDEISYPLSPYSSSTAIYHTVADYLVMPIQNAIHGAVTETLDCLLSSLPGPSKASFGHKCRIIGDLNLPIRHCLVVRKGTRMEDIKWVRSHEQVRQSIQEYAAYAAYVRSY